MFPEDYRPAFEFKDFGFVDLISQFFLKRKLGEQVDRIHPLFFLLFICINPKPIYGFCIVLLTRS